MKALVKVLKSIYDFFAGDAILLVGVAVAFGGAALLSRLLHEENVLIVIVLVGVIVITLISTVGRELGALAAQGNTNTSDPNHPREDQDR